MIKINFSIEEINIISWLKFYNKTNIFIKDNFIINYLNYRTIHYNLNKICRELGKLYTDNNQIENSLELIAYLDDMNRYYKTIILPIANLSNNLNIYLDKLKNEVINYILEYNTMDKRVD